MSPILTAMQACRDEIILLSFVAASDGDFDEDEQDAIVAHVIDRACDPA
jgi:tellurite resistance protein